jgi:ClpP class serine protease
MATEAKKNNLIDEIGYFERAVEIAKEEAKVSDARVVEYIQPFRLFDLLGVQTKADSVLNLTRDKLAGLAAPRIMYLWTGY